MEALVGENGKVSKAEVADVANSLSDSAKVEVKAVKVDNAAHADAATKVDNALKLVHNTRQYTYDGSTEVSLNLDNTYASLDAFNQSSSTHKQWMQGLVNASEDISTVTYVSGENFGAPGYRMEAPGNVVYHIREYVLDQIEEANGHADDLIAALDVTDAAVAGQYVSAVNEVDGKIEVSRADLPTYTLASGSKNGNVAFNGTDVAVAGLKSAAYTEASAYATAAQGAKADSALQSVEVGTGLKVSAKAENKQTVEIDTDVIFVLYGGTASEVI